MNKVKYIDNSERILPFGFHYQDKSSKISIQSIVNSINDNVVIYDYNDVLLNKFLNQSSDFLNDKSKLFIGLTSKNSLIKLKDNGVKSGFFRSTDVKANHAIIIVDRRNAYIAIEKDKILKCNEKMTEELFDYINYLIWNLSSQELLQGYLSEVKEIRHSVLKPDFQNLSNKDSIDKSNLFSATLDFQATPAKKLLKNEENIDNSLAIINENIVSFCTTYNEKGYINIFDDVYCEVILDDSIITAISFKNEKLSSLVGKTIWFDGKKYSVEKNLKIEETIYKPVNEYAFYEPIYEDYINAEGNKMYANIEVEINVLPKKIDQSYQKSKRYEKRNQVNNEMNTKIDLLVNIFPDEEKQLQIIKEESRLTEKAKSYNDFVDKHQIGIKSLANKKKKDKSFSKIIFNEKDYLVPNEVVGKLYEKKDNLYLAIKDENKISQAMNFLKESNLKAELVLDNE